MLQRYFENGEAFYKEAHVINTDNVTTRSDQSGAKECQICYTEHTDLIFTTRFKTKKQILFRKRVVKIRSQQIEMKLLLYRFPRPRKECSRQDKYRPQPSIISSLSDNS